MNTERVENLNLSQREIEIIEILGHQLFTVDYLIKWLTRKDNVFVNAPAALEAMGAQGYYSAVKQLSELQNEALMKLA